MLPQDVLSTSIQQGEILGARTRIISRTVDYEDGGIALNDTSEGNNYQVWKGRLYSGNIILFSDTTEPEIIYTAAGITEFSFTFDQNMAPVISFVQSGVAKFRWYDSTVSDYVITTIGANTSCPKVTLDDKRTLQSSSSDVILGYFLSRTVGEDTFKDLYFRMQRDRYLVSYLLKENILADLDYVEYELNKIGMGKNLRLHFVLTENNNEAGCLTFNPLDPYESDCDISGVPYKTSDCATFDTDNPLKLAGDEIPFVDCEDCDMSADPYLGNATCLYNTDECATFDEDDPFEADCDIAGEPYPTDEC